MPTTPCAWPRCGRCSSAAQTTANEHDWSNWKWAGGNVNTGVAIPDSGAVSDSITLVTTPFAMRVEHVDVQIDLIHPDFTKLRIFLVVAARHRGAAL